MKIDVRMVAAALALVAGFALPARAQEWQEGGKLVLKGDVVTLDSAGTVLRGASVFISGPKIVSISRAGEALPAAAAGAPVVEAQGYIFPGLIDAHNHLEYDMIPLWNVPSLYHDMYEWMGSDPYEKEIKYPKRLLSDPKYLGLQAEIGKYAEVKAITGGTTAIQGSPTNPAYLSLLVRNIEFSNFGTADRITQRSIGIMDNGWQAREAPALAQKMDENKIDAWLVHLAEGVNEAARSEFDVLERIGLAKRQTAIIHGIALGDAELTKMGRIGMKLVASPLDNYLLYGKTADLPLAARRGVVVSIGSDWSPFGSKNLLTELKVTAELNRTAWRSAFSALDIVRMVTTNPAKMLGWEAKVGTVAPGFFADLLVLETRAADPYQALIAATEAQVRLVVIGGQPLYGDQAVLQRLRGADCESVGSAAGKPKAIDLTKPSVTKGSQTYAEIRQVLADALRIDPTWLRSRLTATRNNPSLDVETYLRGEFPLGLRPYKLDPLFAGGDPHYFETLRASRNASFPFDIERYWRDTLPVVSNGRPAVITNRYATIRAEPKIGVILARPAVGEKVVILAERRFPSGPRWYQVQTRIGLKGWVSSMYCRPE